MYTPRHFMLDDPALRRRLVREHPLALLVATDARAAEQPPIALHLPMVWSAEDGDSDGGALEGHLARANPHLAALRDGQPVRLMFSGPDAYVSPSLYDGALNVPTWNYLALEVQGRLALVDERQAKDTLLKRLIAQQDPGYAAHWRGLPEAYQQRMLDAIVGLRVRVLAVAAKAKLSQNRSAAERARVAAHFEAGTAPGLARWMRELAP